MIDGFRGNGWFFTGVVSLAVVGLAGCSGDDTSTGTDSATGTMSATVGGPGTAATASESDSASATMSGSGSGTDSATSASASATDSASASATDSASASASASATATDSGTTGTTGPVTATDTDTGGCAPDKVCGMECCAADQVCSEGFCQKDCGGDEPCGVQQECCGQGQLCYLGECISPGAPCTEITCATQQQVQECDPGQICDPNLGLCVPSKVDENCAYVPPAGKFSAKPQFTWGKRKSVNCTMNSQCQTAEVCMGGKCQVTWPHLEPAADDMPTHFQVSSIPLSVDLDKDCVPEIIFNTYTGTTITSNGVLRAIRGDTGAKVWTVTDAAYRTDSTSNIAVGDIDSDGEAEVVACGAGKYLIAIESDGTPKWKSTNFAGGAASGSVAIAQLDNDGDPEIVFGAAVYDSLGKLLYEGKNGIGINGQGPISCIADLDGDGRQELIAGKTAYKFTGTVKQGNFAGAVLWNSTITDGFCGVGDFDADKKPEVVVVTAGTIRVLNGQTGAQLASFAIPGGGTGGTPNIADFDGDGTPDIAAAGSTRYVVVKYNSMTKTMTKLWHAVTQDGSSQVTGSSVFDFDGDGRNEVVYNDEVYLRIYPGIEPDCQLNPPGPACDGVMTDAEVLLRDRNSSRTRTEFPVIADVDGDFKAEIIFPTNNDSQYSYDAGIEVWGDTLDNWVTTRPVWNQHPYHITSVGLV
ncbi:MAG TPA: VCBS repeat-containing protein, partial [Nannocystaceae bacterium]|nr:VCBS repeat-containing protein [Nannocystaceae bacterium]